MEVKQRYIETPLGVMKLQQTGNYISTVIFMDDKPGHIVNEESELLLQCAGELSDYFNGAIKSFSFLEVARQEGTAFQQRVWNELANIPFAGTISYRQLAIKLGDEKCIRAAAAANGQNNIAIAVPCHRVIGTDGSLTGYAGGLWRKKWLLEHEARLAGKHVQASFFN